MYETVLVFMQSKVKIRVCFLPASAHVSCAAYVDDIDLVLLTLAKGELCPELTLNI